MSNITDIENIANSLFIGFPGDTIDNESPFSKLVRSASVILRGSSVSYEDIKRLTPSVYHRIFLRIAAGRNLDNSFLYKETDILEMLNPFGGNSITQERFNVYGGDLQWCAAKLIAAHLLRTIPLNTTSIKFVDVANNLETQALDDIDRIITLINRAESLAPSTNEEVASSQISLYIANEIDKSTIPEELFNVPDLNSSPATFIDSIEVNNVLTYTSAIVPNNKLSYCHVYMTGQSVNADQDIINTRAYSNIQGSPTNSKDVSYSISINIPILNGMTIDDIIVELADSINSVCLSSNNLVLSNIICTPERGKLNTITLNKSKKELYPTTTTLRNRSAVYELFVRLNNLKFTTRRYSNKVNTELFTVTFYTIDNPFVGDFSSSLYKDASKVIGITDSLSKVKLNNTGFTLGIEGIVFGKSNNYVNLDKLTPAGFFLTVEKGDKPSVTINSTDTSPSNPNTSNDSVNDLNNLDTFYFFVSSDTDFDLQSTLSFRISSTNIDFNIIEINLEFLNDIEDELKGEALAESVVDALYTYSNESKEDTDVNVLGIILGDYLDIYKNINLINNTVSELPLEKSLDNNNNYNSVENSEAIDKEVVSGRVQIVGYKYTKTEYKLIIDVLNIPEGIELAIGNYIGRKTSWSTRRRSIQIDVKSLNGGNMNQTIAEELASVNVSVGQAEAKKSKLLQSVFDKRNLMKKAQEGFDNKWHQQSKD